MKRLRRSGFALISLLLGMSSAHADNSVLLVPLYECHGRELHTTLARQCAADHPQLAEQTERVLQDWIRRNDGKLTELARNCKADLDKIGDAAKAGQMRADLAALRQEMIAKFREGSQGSVVTCQEFLTDLAPGGRANLR